MRSAALSALPFRSDMASLTSSSSDNGENNEPPRICEVQEAADSESRPRATPREEKGGYECEFVEPPDSKLLQSECSICLLILREPHLISCCGHNICETCIGRIQRDGKPCPLCNEPGFTTMANKGLKRTLNEFQVRCPHRELGCEWVDQLGKLNQHLNADPQPERQLEGCPFTSIECIHCKDHVRRHVIAGHQNERCPKRPYTCEYCEEYDSTFEDVANHWAECKCYLLPCPNNCHPSGSGIERQNLEHHVKEECPLTVVECDFHYAGCGVKLPRKDMAGHMKEESLAHISLLAAENQRLAKQLLVRDEKMQQLMQQNFELSCRIDQQERANQKLLKEMSETQGTLLQQQRALARTTRQQQKASQELRQELTLTTETLKRAQREVAMNVQIMPTNIRMSGFMELKGKNAEWFSPPFCTHMCAYKMCLCVYANGIGDGKGTHVSVYTCLMRGEFDYHLKWPFKGDVIIQLQDQVPSRGNQVVGYARASARYESGYRRPSRRRVVVNEGNHTETISYTDALPGDTAGQVTIGERAKGRGK